MHTMNRIVLSVLLSIALTCCPGIMTSFAGSLDDTGSPEERGGGAMYTLEDIYNRLDTGAEGEKRTGPFTEPSAGPTEGTGHTLDEVMDKAPVKDDADGAVEADVLNGKTFWGLTDGEWGPRSGSLVCPDPPTGDATKADVLAPKTFSNESGINLTGEMPDREGDNPSTDQDASGGVNYFSAPEGYYDGNDRVSATDEQVAALDSDITAENIKCGVTIFGVTGTHPPGCVPKTGQTACWDGDGTSVSCEDTGQDGEYQFGCLPEVEPSSGPDGGNFNRTNLGWTSSLGPMFTDNGDGTVTDNLTWLKDANCSELAGTDSWGMGDWMTALSAANTLAHGTCGLADGSSAGDWRLPNINELRSLIDPDQENPALPAGHPFTEARFFAYWSSSTYAGYYSDYAWVVGMSNGSVGYDGKSYLYSLWPVRGGN